MAVFFKQFFKWAKSILQTNQSVFLKHKDEALSYHLPKFFSWLAYSKP